MDTRCRCGGGGGGGGVDNGFSPSEKSETKACAQELCCANRGWISSIWTWAAVLPASGEWLPQKLQKRGAGRAVTCGTCRRRAEEVAATRAPPDVTDCQLPYRQPPGVRCTRLSGRPDCRGPYIPSTTTTTTTFPSPGKSGDRNGVGSRRTKINSSKK